MQNVLNFKNKLVIFVLVFISIFTLSLKSANAQEVKSSDVVWPSDEEFFKQVPKDIRSHFGYGDGTDYIASFFDTTGGDTYKIMSLNVYYFSSNIDFHITDIIPYNEYTKNAYFSHDTGLDIINVRYDSSTQKFTISDERRSQIVFDSCTIYKNGKDCITFGSKEIKDISGNVVFQKPQVPPVVTPVVQGVELLPSLMIIVGSMIGLVALVIFLRVLVKGLRRVSVGS